MLEDEKMKRTQDSIELFHMISNTPFFKQAPIFLTLNKKDVFELFKEAYPGFDGDINNLNECIDHVKKCFLNEIPLERIENKELPLIETFVTCAIEQNSVNEFFQTILKKITLAHPNK